MTLVEFKAWFEGFTEAIDKLPTAKQWARIKARVAEIDGTRFVWPAVPYPYPTYPYRYYSTWNGDSAGRTTEVPTWNAGGENASLRHADIMTEDGLRPVTSLRDTKDGHLDNPNLTILRSLGYSEALS